MYEVLFWDLELIIIMIYIFVWIYFSMFNDVVYCNLFLFVFLECFVLNVGKVYRIDIEC